MHLLAICVICSYRVCGTSQCSIQIRDKGLSLIKDVRLANRIVEGPLTVPCSPPASFCKSVSIRLNLMHCCPSDLTSPE